MYSALPHTVADAVAAARSVALDDRRRFVPLLAAAEAVMAERGLAVCGQSAFGRLEGGDPVRENPDLYHLECYSGDPRGDAEAIADAMWAADPTRLGRFAAAAARGGGAHRKFLVGADGRPLVLIRPLGRNPLAFDPIPCPAAFANEIRVGVAPAALQLYEVYAKLSATTDWPDLVEAEASLRPLFLREAGDAVRSGGSAGGSRKPRRSGGSRSLAAAALLRREWTGQKAQRIEFGGGLEAVWAVTAGRLEDSAKDAAAVLREGGFECEWAVKNPGIPADPLLRRLTLTLSGRAGRTPLLVAYDAGARELVPYVPSAGGRAAPAVRLRFVLAEIWVLQMLHRAGALPDARRPVARALAEFSAAAKEFDRLCGLAELGDVEGALAFAAPESRAGVYVDPDVAAARAAANERFVPPYYPARAKDRAKKRGGQPDGASPSREGPAEEPDPFDGYDDEGR